MSVLPTPNDKEEKLLYAIATGDVSNLPTPNDRKEKILMAIAQGVDVNTCDPTELPVPKTREEKLLMTILEQGIGSTGGSGGSVALQDKTFTENGTYAADAGYDGFGNVTVDVASSGGSGVDLAGGVIDGSITEYSNDKLTAIRKCGLAYCEKLKSVNLPNVTSLQQSAFAYCYELTDIKFEKISGSYFSIPQYCFDTCKKLKKADFPQRVVISSSAFKSCYSLVALIIRGTSSDISSFIGSSHFANCYHILGTVNSTYNPEGLKDGYIYVPRALVDAYTTDSDWSAYATQFRALEDYTVDGTTAGELDESKI